MAIGRWFRPGGVLRVAAPGCLGNAVSADGDSLSVATIDGQPVTWDVPLTLPSGATLVVHQDGSSVYTPAGGFERPDSFRYTVTDGVQESNAGVVQVLVTGRPP